MPTSLLLLVIMLATIHCQMLNGADALTCHVCQSVLGNNVECEGAPNSPKQCMPTKDNYCMARVAFVKDKLSSVVRACSETCEPNHYSCLEEHGECILCCDTDNCNSKSAINRERMLAIDDLSTIPVTPNSTVTVGSDARDSAMAHHRSMRETVILLIICTLGFYLQVMS
ncbi:uncharacterized protein [Ptychodera flava]|uniref:uncharacterized protein n=1 Tax=Ptychodera flava TaxID=63121 RepID=UPI00396A9971